MVLCLGSTAPDGAVDGLRGGKIAAAMGKNFALQMGSFSMEGCRARPLGVDVHPVMAEVNPGSNSLPSMFEKVRPTGLFEPVSQPIRGILERICSDAATDNHRTQFSILTGQPDQSAGR